VPDASDHGEAGSLLLRWRRVVRLLFFYWWAKHQRRSDGQASAVAMMSITLLLYSMSTAALLGAAQAIEENPPAVLVFAFLVYAAHVALFRWVGGEASMLEERRLSKPSFYPAVPVAYTAAGASLFLASLWWLLQ